MIYFVQNGKINSARTTTPDSGRLLGSHNPFNARKLCNGSRNAEDGQKDKQNGILFVSKSLRSNLLLTLVWVWAMACTRLLICFSPQRPTGGGCCIGFPALAIFHFYHLVPKTPLAGVNHCGISLVTGFN